jgi:hypothetical protein
MNDFYLILKYHYDEQTRREMSKLDHNDFFGDELTEGDLVVLPKQGRQEFDVGIVQGFTKCTVKLRLLTRSWRSKKIVLSQSITNRESRTMLKFEYARLPKHYLKDFTLAEYMEILKSIKESKRNAK